MKAAGLIFVAALVSSTITVVASRAFSNSAAGSGAWPKGIRKDGVFMYVDTADPHVTFNECMRDGIAALVHYEVQEYNFTSEYDLKEVEARSKSLCDRIIAMHGRHVAEYDALIAKYK